jgi:phosphohistidine phosphatase
LKLYLVRHAIAAERDAEQWPDDANRPLTAKGIRRFQKAARGLAAVTKAPGVVLSSPFVRAWDTALLLEAEAGWPHPQPCQQLTASSPAELLAVIQAYGSVDIVALVGHEPSLSRFASAVLAPSAATFVELRKGGAVCIDRPDANVTTTGTLIGALPPKVLRKLGS